MLLKEGSVLSSKTQLVTTVVLTAVPLWYLVKKFLNRPKLPYPPGPKGVFFFGNALDLPNPQDGGLPEEKELEWAKKYGLVYTMSLPVIGRTIMVADPELAKKVLITKNYNKSWTYKFFTAVVGNRSMVILNGKDWAKKRRAFNPGFGPGFLKKMVLTMAEKLERFIECVEGDIDANQPTHMLTRAQTFTSDVIVSIAFGEDWGGSKPHPARLWESEICRLSAGIFMNPGTLLFGFRTKRKIREYERLLDNEMMNILERRLAADANANSQDICSIAINQMKEESGGKLSEDDKISITHQLKTFYFAGHDTTASTIAWAAWELSKHDEIVDKIRSEMREHGIWTDLVSPPDYDQLQKCAYLEAVIKETLRLYPPVSFLGRYEENLNETYKGYTIGGAVIGVSPYIMHRHPDLWKEPEVFRPERFLDGSEGDITSKFLAFSRGPRDCIGKYFAILEAKLAISALVARYNLECVDPNDKLAAHVTTMPRNGAQVKFTRRQQVSEV